MKKFLIGAAAGALMFATLAGTAFAAANSHASCVGIDFSVEGPQGLVSAEIHEFLEFAKGSGVPFGSLVVPFAQTHAGSREACGE